MTRLKVSCHKEDWIKGGSDIQINLTSVNETGQKIWRMKNNAALEYEGEYGTWISRKNVNNGCIEYTFNTFRGMY